MPPAADVPAMPVSPLLDPLRLRGPDTLVRSEPFAFLVARDQLPAEAATSLVRDFPAYASAGFFPYEARDCGPAMNRLIDELTSPAFADAVGALLGVVPTLARPPYGGRSPRNVRAFARQEKRLVLWDVNSFDWKGAPAPEIARRVLDRVRPGSIILMHEAREGGEATIDAVRLLVPALRARGLALDTVSGVLAA